MSNQETLPPRRILGIDPGSLRTGFGLVLVHGHTIKHISHGTIILNNKQSLAERLKFLAADLSELIKKYEPHQAVVEDVFFCKNPRSALILGQARGAVLAILGQNDIHVHSITPTAVKAHITGRGQANKFQIAQFVAMHLNISPPSSSDASDALAIALAHGRMQGIDA